MRRPHAGVVVLDIEARVHAGLVVGGGNKVGERRARLCLEFGGKTVLAPGFAHGHLRAGAVAFGKQRPRQRKSPFGATRRLAVEEGDDHLPVGLTLPQCRFGAPAQGHHTWPARIGGDEGRITRKIEIGVVTAQDHPFGELACQRIGYRAGDTGRLVGPAFMREIDHLFDGGKIEGRCVRGCRHRQRWSVSPRGSHAQGAKRHHRRRPKRHGASRPFRRLVTAGARGRNRHRHGARPRGNSVRHPRRVGRRLRRLVGLKGRSGARQRQFGRPRRGARFGCQQTEGGEYEYDPSSRHRHRPFCPSVLPPATSGFPLRLPRLKNS